MTPIRRALDRLVQSPAGWRVLNQTVVRLGLATIKRRRYLETKTGPVDLGAAIQSLSPENVVLHGPFAGMRYPNLEARWSALFPKLLGSYERELHPWLEVASTRGYGSVVDIGCAEGYYAVGLALHWPAVSVHAFDIDPRARELCAAMARANGVDSRVHVAARCDADGLRRLELPSPSLIISDCEGFELDLFTEDLIVDLTQHDVLIELHDYFDVEISRTLKRRFSRTHDVESVFSVDDIQKVHTYDYPELDQWDLHTRRALLTELRPYVMEWIFCRAR